MLQTNPQVDERSNDEILHSYWDNAFPEHGCENVFETYAEYRALLKCLESRGVSLATASREDLESCLVDAEKLNRLLAFMGRPVTVKLNGRRKLDPVPLSYNISLFQQASGLVSWLKQTQNEVSFWQIYGGLERTYVQMSLQTCDDKPSARRWDCR